MQNITQPSFTFVQTARVRAIIGLLAGGLAKPERAGYDRVTARRGRALSGGVAIGNRILRHMLAMSLLALSISWTDHSAAQGMTLVVSEGAEAQGSSTEIAVRYQDFANRISTVLKRPVTVVAETRLPALRQAMDEGRVDLAWIRPNTFIADALANRGYALVASAEGAFYSAFIVSKTSPLRTIKDLEGKQVMHPPKDGNIAKMGVAELRDHQVKAVLQEQRLQEVIVFSVENGFIDAGIVNPRQAAKFKNAGGRILHETRKSPYWGMIASPKLSAANVEAIRKLLLSMNEAPWGKEILAAMEVRSFVAPNPKGYVELHEWLK